LDNFAASASNNAAQTVVPENKSEQDLAVKLDNFEYKLERLLERLEKIEQKILKFESKLGIL
jgi:allophanate hydrolase subunit 1